MTASGLHLLLLLTTLFTLQLLSLSSQDVLLAAFEHVEHGESELGARLARDIDPILNDDLLGDLGNVGDALGGHSESILGLVQLVKDGDLSYLVGQFRAQLCREVFGMLSAVGWRRV